MDFISLLFAVYRNTTDFLYKQHHVKIETVLLILDLFLILEKSVKYFSIKYNASQRFSCRWPLPGWRSSILVLIIRLKKNEC